MVRKSNSAVRTLLKITTICLLAIAKTYSAITIVYNLRIAESTKRPAFEESDIRYTIGKTGFNTNRKKLKGIRNNAGGILSTFSYVTPSFFVRADFAFAKVKETQECSEFSRTQTDDLLLSAGYSLSIKNRTKLTFSGLLGIPTHKDLSLEALQFGSGHVGLGVQIDGAFLYSSPKKHTIRTATRFIHFFARKARYKVNNFTRYFDFHLGDVVDLFIAHHHIFGHHSFELGFDQTFVFAAKIFPNFDDTVTRTNYIRSAFYSTYKYRFLLQNLHNALAIAFSYALDITPKEFGNKRIITTWASWSVSF